MSAESFERLAANLGAKDLFVFHLLSDQRMVNLDGWGRGSGWAGNVCLDPDTEKFLATALENGSAHVGPGSPTRVFGPYWAEEATAVRIDGHIVALGGEGVATLTPEAINQAAAEAIAQVTEVRANKQLADRLELTQAELAVVNIESLSLTEAMHQLASVAAKGLSCELGAVLLLGDDPRAVVADEGWRPVATEDELITALLPLVPATADGIFVEQDLRSSPYAMSPLGFADGLVSRCTVPVTMSDRTGILTVAHAGSAPRGFTDLCRSVASTMGSTAGKILARHL